MKTEQMTGTMVLMIFLLSITAIADLEVPEDQEVLKEKQRVEKCVHLESMGQTSHTDADEFNCVFQPVQKKSSGNGGFYLANGKTLFGLTSKSEGTGFGIVLGTLFPKRQLNLHLGKDIQSLKIKTDVKQKGIGKNSKVIHLKRMKPADIKDKNNLFAYEFLSNLDKDHTTYTMVVKTISKDKVRFYVGGKEVPAKQLKKNSRIFNYYEISFKGKGTIEVVKA